MNLNSDIVHVLKSRQCAIRREMDRRGIAMKVVSFDSGIPYSTLLSYFPEEGGRDPALMPVSAQYMLCGHVPDDVLSLLLPTGRMIIQVPQAVDHDEASKAMVSYLKTKEEAHRLESEAGRDIGPNEENDLRACLTVVQGSVAA